MENIDIIETQKRIIDSIFQNVEDAVIVLDPNKVITHFNKAAQEITGFSVVDTLNKPIDNFLNIQDETGRISSDILCPAAGIELDGVFYQKNNVKLLTKEGMENIVNIRTVKVKEGVNINVGCIIFIEDTFAQSELERMKLDFISMAEHVLRTPVTVIKGYISRLLEEKTTKKLDEAEINYLNNAFTGTTDLLRLIEDLLNITEIRKGEMKLSPVAINLEGVIFKIVNEFKMVAADKGIQIVFIPPSYQLPMVKADISKIQIIIQNLLENALKYTEQGKIEVIMNNRDSFIEVAIKDTGKGIPQEYISHLFTKFYRVKKALEMDYGMGLGLYICRQIVEAHGGTVWVESTENVGSTFHFTLPVA